MEYKKYRDRQQVSKTEDLLKWKREDLETLQKEWDETETENIRLRKEATELYHAKVEEVEKYLTSLGIKLYKYDRRSKKVYEKWFSNITQPLHSSIIGYSLDSKPYQDIVQVYDKNKRDNEWAAARKKEADKLLIESIKKASEFGLITDTLSSEEIIKQVEQLAKIKFELENFPVGTEVSIDDNYCECESYTIGDRRCSCGNRRINHWIEGDIVSGFYLQTEPY